jgi:hypothetical protein
MTKESRTPTERDRGDHHHDHEAARQEHVEWKKAVSRWREDYHETVFEFVRRALPQLELADFEVSLDRHEATMDVAIEIHEQALGRHERALELEQRGDRGASDDFEELHQELDSRHEASREAHERLAARYRSIIETLRSNQQARPRSSSRITTLTEIGRDTFRPAVTVCAGTSTRSSQTAAADHDTDRHRQHDQGDEDKS